MAPSELRNDDSKRLATGEGMEENVPLTCNPSLPIPVVENWRRLRHRGNTQPDTAGCGRYCPPERNALAHVTRKRQRRKHSNVRGKTPLLNLPSPTIFRKLLPRPPAPR